MAKIAYDNSHYTFVLNDAQALPIPTPEGAFAPGSNAIKFPSMRTWVYTGKEWLEEPPPTEVSLANIAGLLTELLGTQQRLLSLWEQQVEEEKG